MKLTIQVDGGNKATVVFTGNHEVAMVLFLLHNGSLHFERQHLAEYLELLIEAHEKSHPVTINFHYVKVRALFNSLSLSMTSVFREMRYNLDVSPDVDLIDNGVHRDHYHAQLKALSLEAQVLPIVMEAVVNKCTVVATLSQELN